MRFDLLHLGLPKCASSYLQYSVFAAHPQIDMLFRRHEPDWGRKYSKLFYYLRDTAGSHRFDAAYFQQTFAGHVAEYRPDSAARTVLSWEGISGVHDRCSNEAAILVTLLGAAEFDRVLLVLREQYSYLYSLWNYGVRLGLRNSLKSYLAERNPYTRIQEPHTNVYRKISYDSYVELLYELFGRDRVKVMLLEDLKGDRRAFLGDLCDFVGVGFRPELLEQPKHNEAIAHGQCRIVRLLNTVTTTYLAGGPLPFSFYRRYRGWFESGAAPFAAGRRPDVSSCVPDEFREILQASNRRLAGLLERDISELGYDCG